MSRRAGFIVYLGLIFLAPTSGLQAEPVRTSDVLRLRTASELDVSRDGKRAVYVVTSMVERPEDKGEYRYDRHLWLAELAPGGAAPRQLTFGPRSDRGPVFSPDGSRIAFVREHEGKPQIWLLPLDGGEAFPLTTRSNNPDGAAGPVWSPDGTRLVYEVERPLHRFAGELPWPYERPGRRFRDEPDWRALGEQRREAETAGETPPPKPSARPDGTLTEIRAWLAKNASDANPRVFDRQDFQAERDLDPDLTFPQLFVIEARAGANPVAATDGLQSFSEPAWSPDGKEILCIVARFNEHPDRVQDGALWAAKADGSGGRLVLDWGGWLLSQPRVSPDGKSVAFIATDRRDLGYRQGRVAIVPRDGGEARWLSLTFDRSVDQVAWAPDGRHLYLSGPDQGDFPLWRVSAKGGKVEPLVSGGRGVREFAVGGERILLAITSVSDPWELYLTDLSGGKERRLTDLNHSWVNQRTLSRPVEAWLDRPDGTKVQYWVMPPTGELTVGAKYPLVLAIHGGPSAMWGPGEFSLWHEFQLLTSWGYGIVYANPRGSGGYGYEFLRGNFKDWGAGPAGDLLAALEAAAELPWVDKNQQFVTGGSYAGYMTAWLISQDQRFRAAVAQRGVYDLAFFFGEGNAWRLVPTHFGGYPWQADTRALLAANSPLTFVERIQTPFLILHSDRDLRTGVNQSETLYKSLKVLGRPVEYVRYPVEGHDLSRSGDPRRRMDRLNRILEFFERYARHPEDPPAARFAAANP